MDVGTIVAVHLLRQVRLTAEDRVVFPSLGRLAACIFSVAEALGDQRFANENAVRAAARRQGLATRGSIACAAAHGLLSPYVREADYLVIVAHVQAKLVAVKPPPPPPLQSSKSGQAAQALRRQCKKQKACKKSNARRREKTLENKVASIKAELASLKESMVQLRENSAIILGESLRRRKVGALPDPGPIGRLRFWAVAICYGRAGGANVFDGCDIPCFFLAAAICRGRVGRRGQRL